MQDHQKGAEQSEGLELALQSDGALPKPMLGVMLANFSKVMECFVKQVGPEQGKQCAEKGLRAILGDPAEVPDTGATEPAMLVCGEADEKSFREALAAEGVEGRWLDRALAGARKARRATPDT